MSTLADLRTLLLTSGSQPSLDLNFLLGALPPIVSFSRTGSTATYFDATGTLQNANANVPRFTHSATAPYALLGLLSEQQSTNLIPNNASFSASTITVSNSTIYTLSFYGTGTISYSGAATGSLVGTGAFPARVSTQITTTTTSLVLTPTGTTQYAQLEQLPFATSIIPTSGTVVTRSADKLGAITLPGNGFLSGGMIVLEHTPIVVPTGLSVESYYRFGGLYDPTFVSNEISIVATDTSYKTIFGTVSKNGSFSVANTGATGGSDGAFRKDAISWSPTLLRYAGNGTSTTPGVINTSLASVPQFQIYGSAIYQQQPSGIISRARLWNGYIASDSQLAGYTRL